MVRSLEKASDGLGYKWADLPTEVTIADATALVSGQPTPAKIAAALTEALQAHIDVVEKRSSLPDDEPTKSVDPAQENIFWRGGDIVSRSDIVTVTHDGSEYVVSVRRAGGV